MNMSIRWIILLCALAATVSAAPPPAPISLDGDWSYYKGDLAAAPEQLPPGLPTMTIPGNWFQRGLDHAGVVWFFRTVRLPRDLHTSRLALRFGGVDYAADVYWDGRPIGSHRGYFAPFVQEIKGGGDTPHLLAVRVNSPREPASAWSLKKTLIKGVLSHHDTRPGGAWSKRGQDANTGGIWGPVQMIPIYNQRISEVRVTTLSLDPAGAQLLLAVTLAEKGPRSGALRYRIIDGDGNLAARGEMEGATAGRIERRLRLVHPRPWWPFELGEPHLYRVEVSLQGSAGTDAISTTFGVRTVTRDARGRVLINGTPFFLRGTNYIGGLYFAHLNEEVMRRDCALMRAAHINAVRVHAHIAAPAFYQIADESGLLIWQDFPLQWGYEESDAFVADAVHQAKEMIGSLYNHPSIIFWNGHNEAPWSSDWMVWKYPDYDPDQNRRLDRALGDVLVQDDPSRPSQANSHTAEHAWFGWYSGTLKDFAKPTISPIVTEFGAQGVPDQATLRTFLRDGELWPLTGKNLELWEYHNFQLHEARDIAKVRIGSSVAELIGNSQAYQARLVQFAAEALRHQKWQPVAGIFHFMFTEHWPSINWGVLDYLRHPKPGYFALQRAYQPLLPIAVRKGKPRTLTLHVLNDGQEAYHGLRLRIVTTGLPRGGEQVLLIDVPKNDQVTLAETLPCPSDRQQLTLTISDDRGLLLAENSYAPGYFEE